MRPGKAPHTVTAIFVFVSAVNLGGGPAYWLMMVTTARLAFITAKMKCQSLVLFFPVDNVHFVSLF